MKRENVKIKTVANHGSAMETGNHFKNGVSLKNLMSRGNFLKTYVCIVCE
jgi:hypothetical protein